MRKIPHAFLPAALPLAALLAAGAGLAAPAAEPFGYPASAIEAPATLADPPAALVHIGAESVRLGVTLLDAVAAPRGARIRHEGEGDFARDWACLTGGDRSRPFVLWLIATGSPRISEAQLERRAEGAVPAFCGRIGEAEDAVRFGAASLGMSLDEADARLGAASHEDGFGWRFWLSQQFVKNSRGLEGLELNWLGARFRDGRAERLFTSFVRNP